MPPEERDPAYLWDMLEAARAVQSFITGRTFEDYRTDLMLRSAVERQVEIIGEAARNVSPTFRAAHPEVPWEAIVAQRHVLAHDYGDVKHDRIWRVSTERVPELIALLQALMPPLPGDSAV